MFEEYKVYKVWHKKEGRWFAILFANEKNRTSMSWARYQMCLHLGRRLDRSETVDHIDGDKTNDDISNLQILSLADNIKKSAKQPEMITLTCPYCGKVFQRRKKNTNLVPYRSHIKTMSCSRHCAGKLQFRDAAG